jgi:hypothetical protein
MVVFLKADWPSRIRQIDLLRDVVHQTPIVDQLLHKEGTALALKVAFWRNSLDLSQIGIM